MDPMASRRGLGAGQAFARWYRHYAHTPSSLWLWRAGAAVSLILGLIFAALALLSSMAWAFLCFLCLAAAVVCLIRSEPEDSPLTAHTPAMPRAAPSRPAPAAHAHVVPAPEPPRSAAPGQAPSPAHRAPRRDPVPKRSGNAVPKRSGIAVKDVMTPTPTALPTDAPVAAAARAMRDLDVGAVDLGVGQPTYQITADPDASHPK